MLCITQHYLQHDEDDTDESTSTPLPQAEEPTTSYHARKPM